MKLQQLKWLIAAVTMGVLVLLMGWQQRRSRLVAGCVTSGGVWDGRTSHCVPLPGSPILQRDLRRS